MKRELRRFGIASLIYLVPTLLLRGANFFLAPLYAHSMSAEDFGRVGVAATLTTLLITVLSGGLHSTIYRLHHDWPDEHARQRFYGTILTFLILVPLGITAAAHGLLILTGIQPFRTLPTWPYLGLILWSGYFAVFQSLPLAIFVARELPRRAVAFNAIMLSTTVITNLLFVVVLDQGAVGQLRATLAANIALSIASVIAIKPYLRLQPSLSQLRIALAFSLPLVPHLIATWGLAVADRLVLERSVSTADIGRYQLAATFANVIVVFAGAMMRGLHPIVARKFAQHDGVQDVPKLGTLAVLAVTMCCVVVGLVSDDVLILAFPPAYHGAAQYIPWLIAGAGFQGLYQIVIQGTMQAKQTRWVPVISLVAILANLGINILFVPRHGAMVAAVATLIAYVMLALLHGVLAHRVHPIAWEYSRWLRLALAATASVSLTLSVTQDISVGLPRGSIRGFAGIGLFLALLVASRFVRARDLPLLMRSLLRPETATP